jgi:hypothetical protein
MIDAERQPYNGNQAVLRRCFHHSLKRLGRGVKQRPLVKQVFARVSGQSELWKQNDERPICRGFLDQFDRPSRVVRWIGDADGGRCRRYSNEIVIQEIKKLLAWFHCVSRVEAPLP